MKGEFGISLARMLVQTLKAEPRLEVEIFSVSSSDLPLSRTRLLQKAMEWQARFCLWLDTDHVFPPESLLRLLSHRLPVVGLNQARRTEPTGPVATRLAEGGRMEHVWTTEELAREGKVEEVAHVGLAFTLVDMLIFHQVQAHVGERWARWEPFERRRDPASGGLMGEDASFMAELREAGVKIHVDHALSWAVGHIGERVFTNADTVADREKWLSRQ
jgi:hypothetical protein